MRKWFWEILARLCILTFGAFSFKVTETLSKYSRKRRSHRTALSAARAIVRHYSRYYDRSKASLRISPGLLFSLGSLTTWITLSAMLTV